MSASLLGLEMCIRDSSSMKEMTYFGEGNDVIQDGQNPAPTLPPELLSACLLYTSDAADDM
eukprot:12597204-Alexandrium_andersonii.AAC.1